MNLRILVIKTSPPPVDVVKSFRDESGMGIVQAKKVLGVPTRQILQYQQENGEWVDVPFVLETQPWVDPRIKEQ